MRDGDNIFSEDVTESSEKYYDRVKENIDWHEWTKNISVTEDDLQELKGKHFLYEVVKKFYQSDLDLSLSWLRDRSRIRYETRRNYKTVSHFEEGEEQ